MWPKKTFLYFNTTISSNGIFIFFLSILLIVSVVPSSSSKCYASDGQRILGMKYKIKKSDAREGGFTLNIKNSTSFLCSITHTHAEAEVGTIDETFELHTFSPSDPDSCHCCGIQKTVELRSKRRIAQSELNDIDIEEARLKEDNILASGEFSIRPHIQKNYHPKPYFAYQIKLNLEKKSSKKKYLLILKDLSGGRPDKQIPFDSGVFTINLLDKKSEMGGLMDSIANGISAVRHTLLH